MSTQQLRPGKGPRSRWQRASLGHLALTARPTGVAGQTRGAGDLMCKVGVAPGDSMQGIRPRSPVGSWRMACRAAQAETAVPQCQARTRLSRLRQLRRLIGKRERCATGAQQPCYLGVFFSSAAMGVSLAARGRSHRRRGSAISAAAGGWGSARQRSAGPGPGRAQLAGWGGARARSTPRPCWRRPAGAGGARCAWIRTRSRTRWSAPWLHRPPTSDPRTTSFWGPPVLSSGYASRLRRPGQRGDQSGVAARRHAPWRGAVDYPVQAAPVRRVHAGGPWCGPAIAAGKLARPPQPLPEPPAPRPIPLS